MEQRLSIREASRFVIGAAIMRARAIEASSIEGITFDKVAEAALRKDDDGAKLRQSIDMLADAESGYLRNTPPHALKTDRVMQSREAECRAFAAIHAAVITTVEFADNAKAGDAQASQNMRDNYIVAFRTIEEAPGSTADRRQLKALLHNQAQTITSESGFVAAMLKSAETAYLEEDADAILSRYENRGGDFEM